MYKIRLYYSCCIVVCVVSRISKLYIKMIVVLLFLSLSLVLSLSLLFSLKRWCLLLRSHASPFAFQHGGFVRQLLSHLLRLVVVRLRETTGNVAFRRGFHVQDDQKGHRDNNEQRDGDDAQNVHVRQSDVRDGLVRARKGFTRRGGERQRRSRRRGDGFRQLLAFLGNELFRFGRSL